MKLKRLLRTLRLTRPPMTFNARMVQFGKNLRRLEQLDRKLADLKEPTVWDFGEE